MSPWDLANMDEGQTIEMKWLVPGSSFKKPVAFKRKGDRLWFLKLPFSKGLIDEIKTSFSGYRWHGYESPSVKQWSVKHCQHNWFQIMFLAGQNPYKLYDDPLLPYTVIDENPQTGLRRYRFNMSDGRIHDTRWLYAHQAELVSQVLTRHFTILAAEMGSGKTLSAIEAMEASGETDWMWAGPRSALASVELEFKKWKSFIQPTFVTYSGLEKHNEFWESGRDVYKGLILDESSRAKNVVAKRTIAAQYIADCVRLEHGFDGYVVEMSGSPAPKSPVDWYSQCEIAMPGFLKEGHVNKLKDRLAVVHQRESATGGVYPHLVTWLDDDTKCSICGERADHDYHDDVYATERCMEDSSYHIFKQSKNEVSNLYKRMKGLVNVKFKRDCLDLPEKIYKRIQLEPAKQTLRAAKLLAKTCTSTIKALTFLRQLSDGFQYTESEVGRETCGICKGTRTVIQPNYYGPEKTVSYLRSIDSLPSWYDGFEMADSTVLNDVIIDPSEHPDLFKYEEVACPHCHGKGEVIRYERSTDNFKSPKIDALLEILDEHEDVGRLVVFAGFTGSIDIVCDTVKKAGWEVIRVDGRGWHSTIPGNAPALLEAFQGEQEKHPKVVFVGQPGAAGLGLTLTASPTILFYSNDFNSESRLQAEDRIHRPGMNKTRGATIIDLIHLPSDEYVLENLKKKKDLQSLTLGDLKEAFTGIDDDQ